MRSEGSNRHQVEEEGSQQCDQDSDRVGQGPVAASWAWGRTEPGAAAASASG